jgi:hypothetical protein
MPFAGVSRLHFRHLAILTVLWWRIFSKAHLNGPIFESRACAGTSAGVIAGIIIECIVEITGSEMMNECRIESSPSSHDMRLSAREANPIR